MKGMDRISLYGAAYGRPINFEIFEPVNKMCCAFGVESKFR